MNKCYLFFAWIGLPSLWNWHFSFFKYIIFIVLPMIQDINLGVLNFSFIFFSSHSFLFSLFTLYLLVIVALNIIDWFQSITSLFEEAFFLGFYFWKEWGQGFHLFYIIFYLIIFGQFFFKILILYFIFIINIYFILARI